MFYASRAFCALALFAVATHADADMFTQWNLMVRHDLASTSEVAGSALIGGNLSGTSNYAVHGATAFNGDGLAVGGNITGNSAVHVNSGGNLRIGGTVQPGSRVDMNGGGLRINDASLSTTVDAVFEEVEAISASLADLTANGVLDRAGNLTASPTFMNGYNVAVYNLMNDDLQRLGQLNLVMGSADSVILNVFSTDGVVDLAAPPNIIGDFNQRNSPRILWNMPDATSVLVNNSFSGALFAPYGDLKLLGGGINGTVAVNSFSRMGAEVRGLTYTGYVPEPVSLWLLSVGGVLALRRRRAA